MSPEYPNSTECHCLAVRSAARHVTQFYDEFLAPIGLRSTQFSILSKLKRKGGATINVLAKDMVMDRSTLTRNLQPLVRDGLIGIGPAADDGRAKEVRLTRAGEKRLQAGVVAWKAAQARFESSFGSERSFDLRDLLHQVVANPFDQ